MAVTENMNEQKQAEESTTITDFDYMKVDSSKAKVSKGYQNASAEDIDTTPKSGSLEEKRGIEILKQNKWVYTDSGKIFDPKDADGNPVASGRKVRAYKNSSPFVPVHDPNYVFHAAAQDIIVWLREETPEPLYIFGPTGCGKTSCMKQLLLKLNYPTFEITGHDRLEFMDMIGHLTVSNNNMEFQYGPLSLAMKYGGTFILNEIDLLSPGTAAGLNSILDGQPLCIPENGGEIIYPHTMFRFVATANTNGAADETGLYQGTNQQNIAFMDRFRLTRHNYPSANIENEIIRKVAPEITNDDIISRMIQFANEIRKAFMGEDETSSTAMEVTLSTRTLVRLAKLYVRYYPLKDATGGKVDPLKYAIDRAIGFRASRSTRILIHEIANRIFTNNAAGYMYNPTLED